MLNNQSRSTLFLMEQLIVIGVFAICAAVCVNIFVGSFIMVSDSKDMKNALLIAENGAECYKAAAGDAEKAAMILSESVIIADNGGTIALYYDEKCQSCEKDEADYILLLKKQDNEEASVHTLFCDISVEKSTGEEIIAFTVAARGRMR